MKINKLLTRFVRRSSDQQAHDAYLSLRCGREDYEDYWTREDSLRAAKSENAPPATQAEITREPEFDGATAFPA